LIVRQSVPLSISLSADGQKLAIAGDDGRVDAWDFLADQPLQSFVGHAAGPLSARWHTDNVTLVSASADKSLRIGKLAALRTIRAAEKELLDVIAYNGGAQLAALTADGLATLIDFGNGQLVRKLGEGLNDARSLAMRPDSQRVAVGYADGQVRIWNVANGELLQAMKTHASVQSLAWTADGIRLAAGTAVGPSSNPAAAAAVPATPPVSALYLRSTISRLQRSDSTRKGEISGALTRTGRSIPGRMPRRHLSGDSTTVGRSTRSR
jgi:WD40 repeat protein